MTGEEPKEPQDDLKEELRRLGDNLHQSFSRAWESEERKEIQQDLEEGLNELATSLRKMANEFEQSQAGQQVKSDLHDFNERLQSGELQNRLRSDIFGALRKANEEIEKSFHPKKEE